VVFHPTEPLVASAGWDEQLQLWQLEGRTLHLVETGSGWGRIASLAWHPDGQSILIGTMAGQIQTLGRQGSSGASLTLQSGSGVACLAVSPAGDLLASGHADGTVRLWHLADQKLFQSFASHQRGVTALTWDPSGRLLLSGGWDRDIFFWEAATGRELGTVEVEGAVRSLAWRPQYNHVACAYAPQNVVLWQVRMEALK
jgi:WD40 repeat protein